MTRALLETSKLLEWLGEVLNAADGVDVDVVIVGRPDSPSSVQITFHGVPGPLGGLDVGPHARD